MKECDHTPLGTVSGKSPADDLGVLMLATNCESHASTSIKATCARSFTVLDDYAAILTAPVRTPSILIKREPIQPSCDFGAFIFQSPLLTLDWSGMTLHIFIRQMMFGNRRQEELR